MHLEVMGTYDLVITVAVMTSIHSSHVCKAVNALVPVSSAVFIWIYAPALEPLGLRQ